MSERFVDVDPSAHTRGKRKVATNSVPSPELYLHKFPTVALKVMTKLAIFSTMLRLAISGH